MRRMNRKLPPLKWRLIVSDAPLTGHSEKTVDFASKNRAFFRETGGLFFVYCRVCDDTEGNSSHAAVRCVCPYPLFALMLTQYREFM